MICTTLLDDDFIVALPQNSPLAQQAQVAASDLALLPFILPEQAWGTMEVARRGGFTARTRPNPGGLVAVITLVSLDQGVAIVPASVTDRILMPGVVYRKLSGENIPGSLAIASLRHEKSPVVQAFLKQLISVS